MSIPRILLLLTASSLLCTTLGGIVGWILGSQFPDYYRNLFPRGHEAGFNPIAVGVGQGMTQGLVGGLIVGTLLVFILAWLGSRPTSGGTWSESSTGESS